MSVNDGLKESGSSMVSLDVLAHVATATLEETGEVAGFEVDEFKPDVEYVIEGGQDFPDEILQGIQSLTLEAIHALSIKSLATLFTNLYFDKERQHFTCTCAFMPEKCRQSYSSYGSEARAVSSMHTHLAHHLFQLLQEAERDPLVRAHYFPTVFFEAPFTRETHPLEIKREIDDEWRPAETKPMATSSDSPMISPRVAVTLLPQEQQQHSFVASKHAYGLTGDESETVEDRGEGGVVESNHEQRYETDRLVDLSSETIVLDDDVNLTGAEIEVETMEGEAEEESEDRVTIDLGKGKLGTKFQRAPFGIVEDEDDDNDESDLSRFAHDHAYTFSKPTQEPFNSRATGKGKSKSTISPIAGQPQRVLGAKQFIPATDSSTGNVVFLPIVDGQIILDNVENKTYLINEDAEVLTAIESQEAGTSAPNRRPDYPPMPHANYGTVKLHIQEEWEPTTAEEERYIEEDQRTILDPSGPTEEARSEEWIKRTALKHIRYLRGRKKKDNYVLSCRICNDGKVFTAAATLLYHYRSHAGIKAFICQICNTSFTRQHSLNYHMLIHNGQSRFTCDACGRQFRHPQHYKEHLRRHTGETPFTCTDCGATFKTRNTFKRHLRTRHEKLLTVEGIRHLSESELRNLKIKEIKREVQSVQEIHYKLVDIPTS